MAGSIQPLHRLHCVEEVLEGADVHTAALSLQRISEVDAPANRLNMAAKPELRWKRRQIRKRGQRQS